MNWFKQEILRLTIRSIWDAILPWVITYVVTHIESYSIPTIIIFTVVVGVICLIIGGIKLYEIVTNTKKLEIIYDNGKYNKERYVEYKNGIYNNKISTQINQLFAYTIGVKNHSNAVVKACKVTEKSEYAIHAHTHEFQCDINPGATELFIINTSRFQAELASKKIEKEVEVSAENVSAVTKNITL